MSPSRQLDFAEIRRYAGVVSRNHGISAISCPVSTEDLEQQASLAIWRGRKSVSGPMQDLIRHEHGRQYQKRRFLGLHEIYVRPRRALRPARAIPNLPQMNCLKAQERLVIERYYWGEMLYREIGELMGLCESRVCQIHQEALEKLREKMLAQG